MRYSVCVSRREHTPFIRHHNRLKMRERWIRHLMCWVHAIILYNHPKYMKDAMNCRVQCHSNNLGFVSVTLNIPKHNNIVLFANLLFLYVSAHEYLPRDLLCLSYHIFKAKLKLLPLAGQIKIDS